MYLHTIRTICLSNAVLKVYYLRMTLRQQVCVVESSVISGKFREGRIRETCGQSTQSL